MPTQPKSHRLIATPDGTTAKVSIADYDAVIESLWLVAKNGYIVSYGKLLHRFVLERALGRQLQSGEHVDHINNDKTDNRRENLRLTTWRGNSMNRPARRDNKLGLKGVRRNKTSKTGSFHAYIQVDFHWLHIGAFTNAEEAAYVRDQWALQLHGEFARTNYQLV